MCLQCSKLLFAEFLLYNNVLLYFPFSQTKESFKKESFICKRPPTKGEKKEFLKTIQMFLFIINYGYGADKTKNRKSSCSNFRNAFYHSTMFKNHVVVTNQIFKFVHKFFSRRLVANSYCNQQTHKRQANLARSLYWLIDGRVYAAHMLTRTKAEWAA